MNFYVVGYENGDGSILYQATAGDDDLPFFPNTHFEEGSTLLEPVYVEEAPDAFDAAERTRAYNAFERGQLVIPRRRAPP